MLFLSFSTEYVMNLDEFTNGDKKIVGWIWVIMWPFLLFLVGWDWVHLVLRPLIDLIIPAPNDRWCVWSSRCNENWQGKPKYSKKTYPSATLFTTNPTWPDPGRRSGKPATNSLSYGAAYNVALVRVRLSLSLPHSSCNHYSAISLLSPHFSRVIQRSYLKARPIYSRFIYLLKFKRLIVFWNKLLVCVYIVWRSYPRLQCKPTLCLAFWANLTW
jgi:hypothetical protein